MGNIRPLKQLIGVAATRTRRFLGKVALEGKPRLIHPVHLGQRLFPFRQVEVRALLRGVERQPAFGEEAMRDHGNERQQDAYRQGGRLAGFLIGEFDHNARVPSIWTARDGSTQVAIGGCGRRLSGICAS